MLTSLQKIDRWSKQPQNDLKPRKILINVNFDKNLTKYNWNLFA